MGDAFKSSTSSKSTYVPATYTPEVVRISTHSDVVMQSCMMPFQRSPVALRNRVAMASGKFWKCACRPSTSPARTIPKRFMPITA